MAANSLHGIPEWSALYALMAFHYPELEREEVYIKIIRDYFDECPNNVVKMITSALPDLSEKMPEIITAIGALKNNPKVVFGGQIGAIARDVGPKMRKAFSNFTNNGSKKLEPVMKDANGARIIGQSMLDRADYFGRWTTQSIAVSNALQIYKGVEALKKIGQSLDKLAAETYDRNCLLTQGGGGPDGYARPVYDFIEAKIEENPEENHQYFVYHPDTDWIPAFKRLIRAQPLPPCFCAIFDDLDVACQRLLDIRRTLNEERGNGNHVVLHLLIPGWYHLSIVEPLHFSEDLQPFLIHGLKHKGKPYTTFNLPAAPSSLLDGVGNVTDPHGWNTMASLSAQVTFGVGNMVSIGGSWVAGVGAATALGVASSGVALLVIMPICCAGHACSLMGVNIPTANKVYNLLRERPPRILGSEDVWNAEYRQLIE